MYQTHHRSKFEVNYPFLAGDITTFILAILNEKGVLKCFRILAPLHVTFLRSRLVRTGAFSSQPSSSTAPLGYKGIETKAYVAVASKAEHCCHVAS